MKPLQDTDPCPQGKFKGKPMQDLPVKYLHWLWVEFKIDENSPVGDYIKRNLDVLKLENTDLIWTRN